MRNIILKTFTQGYIRTDSGRERIVAAFILGRLLSPEIMSEHRIEIQAALQRFKPPTLTDIATPRNEILLERHG